jgi:hypothetical protein
LDGPNPQRGPIPLKFDLSGPKLNIDPMKINNNQNPNMNMNMNQYMINNPNTNLIGQNAGYGMPQNYQLPNQMYMNNMGGGPNNIYLNQPYQQQPMNMNYQQQQQYQQNLQSNYLYRINYINQK